MFERNRIIDDIFAAYSIILAKDFVQYQNHVYRVFETCKELDPDAEHVRKYAITAAFHDIGIWTHHTFDYITPSIIEVEIYLDRTGQSTWFGEISEMIYWHHKVTPYRGTYSQTVETFRKADWLDVSMGLFRFGCSTRKLKEIRKQFPLFGFHRFLIKLAIINLVTHPLKPLPMFRR